LSERDAPLSAAGGFGVALREDFADDIPLVGFAEDDGGLDDVAFIGFDDEAAPSGVGADSRKPSALSQRLGQGIRRAASVGREAALRLFWWLRYQLTGTQLRARRSRAALVLLGALLLSIGSGMVLRKWLPARPVAATAEALPVAPPQVKLVLVARQQIGRGRVLKSSDLRWQSWPTADIEPSYVVQGKGQIPDFYGYVARQPIEQGEPISSANIVDPGKRGALAAVLPPGMRAVSVDIREENAASGLIMPGDDVDLLLALPVPASDRGDDANRYAVQIVLGNVRVLAIDQEIAGHDGRAMIGKTATLQVTPKEAEIVTLAGTMAQAAGNLRLALRSLVPATAASFAPSAEEAQRRFLVESDISRLMPQRKNPAASPLPPTIVRRGQAATAQPSPAGS
jgi:pilus assembly protein CpaB